MNELEIKINNEEVISEKEANALLEFDVKDTLASSDPLSPLYGPGVLPEVTEEGLKNAKVSSSNIQE